MKIGWKFPSCGGGKQQGFNDSGIETFSGQPFENLAREIIQNSLDARAYEDKPVIVKFVVDTIRSEDFPGRSEFVNILKECKKESRADEDAEKFFQNAVAILEPNKKIKCLYISDHNTTGLRDDTGNHADQWLRLVKKDGQTGQDSQSGGSYGIGKNAPFAVSNLRTVFYYTLYKNSGKITRKAQGKSILISHDLGGGDYSQATGFYGIKNQCEKMTGEDIPDALRRQRQDDDEGTTLLIPGLIDSPNWRDLFTAMVIVNFFQAIHDGKLIVEVGDTVINDASLPSLFEQEAIVQVAPEEVKTSYFYYLAVAKSQANVIQEDKTLRTLGHCILRFIVEETYPQQVAFLRRGMKITDSQKSLKRWSGCADFIAVCFCDNEKGNALLRRMENPAHNAFDPARLGAEKALGERALKEIGDWVREIIKGATAQVNEQVTELSKMKEYFSSEEDNLPGESEEEKDFDGDSNYSLKPTKIRPSRPLPIPGADGGEDEGDEGGGSGGGGGSRGGRGSGGTSTEQPILIDATRVIARPQPHEKQIMFTPRDSGAAVLSLRIAGDSFYEPISILGVSGDNNVRIKDGSIHLNVEKNRRVKLTVKLPNEDESALSMSLAKKKGKE